MEIIQQFSDLVFHTKDFLEGIVKDYGLWIYAVLFLIIFCETGLVVTPFLPGDSLLFAAGAVAGAVAESGHPINIHLMVVLLICAAIVGDNCNYFIGKFFGEKLFRNPNSKIFKQSYLVKTHDFYEKYGGRTIFFARFVPIIRTFAPFVAGMGKMAYVRFISYCIAVGCIWVTLFIYCGYFFGRMEFVQKNLSAISLAIIFVSLLPAIIGVWREKTKRRLLK